MNDWQTSTRGSGFYCCCWAQLILPQFFFSSIELKASDFTHFIFCFSEMATGATRPAKTPPTSLIDLSMKFFHSLLCSLTPSRARAKNSQSNETNSLETRWSNRYQLCLLPIARHRWRCEESELEIETKRAPKLADIIINFNIDARDILAGCVTFQFFKDRARDQYRDWVSALISWPKMVGRTNWETLKMINFTFSEFDWLNIRYAILFVFTLSAFVC